MSHNSDMIRMLRLVEGQQFAGLPEQQPGDQVRGTEQAKKNGQQHPFHNRLVGEEISLEDKLSKKYQDMKDLHSKEEKEKDELEKKLAEGWDKLTPQQKAHEYNLDAAQKEMDRRHAQGEDMTGATIDKKTYKIVKPKQQGVAEYGPAATAALQQGQHPIQVAAADRKDQENTLNINRSAMKAQQDVANGLDPTQTAAGNGVAEGLNEFAPPDNDDEEDDEEDDFPEMFEAPFTAVINGKKQTGTVIIYPGEVTSAEWHLKDTIYIKTGMDNVHNTSDFITHAAEYIQEIIKLDGRGHNYVKHLKKRRGVAEGPGSLDYDKILNAIAALYGDDIWDNDVMQDLANDLAQAGPTDRELDFIIAKGKLPRRLSNTQFTNNDNVQFGGQGVAEGLNELSVSTLSSYGKKAEKSIDKKLDKAAGHSEKATKLYDKGTASAVAKSYDHEDQANNLHKQVNKRDANMDQAAGKLKNKMSKGVAEGWDKLTPQQKAHEYNLDAAQREMDRRHAQGEDMKGAKIDKKTYKIVKPKQQGVAEGDRPFRGVDGAFDRGDDERHDLDPTDWYIVKDGEMFSASIYPRQVQQAIAQGFSRTRAEAKAKSQANSQTGSSEELEESQQESPMERPMLHRIMMRHMDLIEKYGIDLVLDSVRDVADSMNIGPDDEIGTSDVSAAMVNVMNQLKSMDQQIDEYGSLPGTSAEPVAGTAAPSSGSSTPSSTPANAEPAGGGSPNNTTLSSPAAAGVSAGGSAPATPSALAGGSAAKPGAPAAPQPNVPDVPITPDEKSALDRIRANAGLKTQFDNLLKQVQPKVQ